MLNLRWRIVAATILVGMWASSDSRADDEVTISAEVRKAVAALHEKGASLGINGEFHVTSVTFSGNDPATDADLVHLKHLPHLESVTIFSPKFTAAAIEHLKPLKTLRSVTLHASIDREARAELREALAGVSIRAQGSTRGGFRTPSRFQGSSRFGGTRGGSDRSRGSLFSTRSSTLLQMLRSRSIQEELGLSEDQVTKVTSLYSHQQTQAREVFDKLRTASPPDQDRNELIAQLRESIAKISKEVEDSATALLKPEQLTRLRQIQTQRMGVARLIHDDVVEQLGLTDDQKGRIGSLLSDRTDLIRGFGSRAGAEERSKAISDVENRILDVLNDEQKKMWEAAPGELFDEPGRSSGTGRRPDAQPARSN